jgi:hypothetical protein
MQGAAALIGLMLVSSPHDAPPKATMRTTRAHVKLDGWDLRTWSDGFAGRTVCRLSRGRVTYYHGALVVQLSRHVDTAEAVYRVDGGPPTATRADQQQYLNLRFEAPSSDLGNPSGGQVWIPQERVLDAVSLAVAPKPYAHPATFRIDSLRAILDKAQSMGCQAGDFTAPA